MAQEEEDVRDYNLTEEQKAIKAKYPPVNRKYEYLDHTADVQLHAWGDTLEEAFEQCAMAMFGYMTDIGTVEPLQTVEVETQGDDLQSLLFHFLDEWLYKFSADEFFIPREVKVLSIDQRNFKLRSIGWGEEFSLSKHPQCLSPTYKWKRLTSVIQALWRPRQADHLRSGVQDQPDQHGEIPS
ncbi:protein archease isoform X3 [Callithrix jacchus]|uniref:protein archease isoform X3 n=1 Tax=Callithrix jacchus TaxID=9483 RepID=UPI00159E8C01|nr:protein archease isoform X3 [Callithrix jacchus]